MGSRARTGPDDQPLLSVDDLTRLYANGNGVRGVSFQVQPGEVVALLGPNGSGKTTTLRCVMGLLVPDSGAARVGGHLASDPMAQSRSAFVPDLPALYPALTVLEHLRFRARAFGLPSDERHLRRALEELEIEALSGRLAGELSRGQQQRAMLAAAVLQNASLYVLDEPTVGLDPPSLHWLAGWLVRRAGEGAGVLVSTHSLDFVARVAHRVVSLREGSVIAEAPLPEDPDASRRWQDEMVARMRAPDPRE